MIRVVNPLPMVAILIPMAALTLTGDARAQGFVPNHVFVCAYNADAISEFDADGTFVRSFGTGSGIDGPRDLVFGADGLLYVTGNNGSNRVYVFDGSGTEVQQIGVGSGLDMPSGLAFGPNGNLYVTSFGDGRVLEFSPGGAVVGTLGVNTSILAPSDIEFGVDGHAFLSSTLGDRIYELDTTDILLRTIDLEGQPVDGAVWIGFSPEGRLLATGLNLDAIFELALDGTVLDDTPTSAALMSPNGAAIGPDGALWVSSNEDDKVIRLEQGAVTLSFGDATTTDGAVTLAFAPFYFDARINGTLLVAGQDPRKVKLDVTLGYSPGSRTVTVLPDETDESEFTDVFGTTSRVFRGIEITRSDKQRQLDLASIAQHEVGQAASALSLAVTGKNKAGLFRPKQFSGKLQVAAEGRVFNASIKPK